MKELTKVLVVLMELMEVVVGYYVQEVELKVFFVLKVKV